jgi:nucleoside-diphosphate-sugar epimerase
MLTDGSEERYFLHIIDACRGIVEAMRLQPKTPYDIAGERLVSVSEIARLISEATHAIIIPGERASLHPSAPLPNYLPGWTPCITIEEGIAMTVDLYQSEPT